MKGNDEATDNCPLSRATSVDTSVEENVPITERIDLNQSVSEFGCAGAKFSSSRLRSDAGFARDTYARAAARSIGSINACAVNGLVRYARQPDAIAAIRVA